MRKSVWIIFITFLWLFPLTQIKGQALSLEEIVDRMQNNYDKMEDFSASFTQISVNRSLNQELQTQGRVFLKKPGLMRWEYGPPDNQLIVSDDSTLWMHLPKLKQVYKEDARRAFDIKSPLSFLSGKGKITEDFRIFLLDNPGKGEDYKLKLIPKEVHPALNQIFLVVDSESFWIKSSKINDVYENSIELIFSDIKINQKLSSSLFQFIIPQGSEILTPSEGK